MLTALFSTLALFGTLAAAAWEGTPKNNAVANGLKFLGCTNEVPGRALTGPSYSADDMTVESCLKYCQAGNYWMSGVEAGRECYCGKYVAPPASFHGDAGACDMPCTGDPRQRCGGWGKMSVFNNTAYKGASAPAGAANYAFESCYMEPMWDRALANLVLADDAMTVEKCMAACGAGAGYKYCGLEYGRECYGGNTLDPRLQDANDPTCAMQCDMPCGGNRAQMCGGRSTIAVYQKKGTTRREDGEDDDGGSGANLEMVRAMKGRFIRVRKPAKGMERGVEKVQERDVDVENDE
ncbi:hypothetical protein SLS62_010991 [Diatrype stigma]|uniref:WSC domain-containing protein n=1 Tax=Diatrype stigma TaxID=117547 RepID=A0AAN9YFJ3_9PEZI